MKSSAYNIMEENACKKLCNRIVEAYKPTHFYNVGYPTRITSTKELWKYAESMHDGGFDVILNSVMNGINETEFSMLKYLSKQVVELSSKDFDKKVLPRASMLRAIWQFRHINALLGFKPSIFEIGPGSGYLGILLMLEKYPYYCMDNTQAFSLFQKYLWKSVNLKPSQYSWWDYVDTDFHNIEVVTANHVICEMHNNAFKHMLRKFQTAHTYIIDGFGCSKIHERKARIKQFSEHGYDLQYKDKIFIFSKDRVKYKPKNITSPISKSEIDNFLNDVWGSNDYKTDDEIFLSGTK